MAAGDGLISMTPTSIAYSGTSASINADGGVDFSAVTSLSLNGVFVSGIDNYLVVFSTTTSVSETLSARLRLSGTDASTNYNYQRIYADSTSVGANRGTSQDRAYFASIYTTSPNGLHLHLYGPGLAQATAYRSVTVLSSGSAQIYDYAGTHTTATAYDGITFIPTSGALTGNVHVFGYEE